MPNSYEAKKVLRSAPNVVWKSARAHMGNQVIAS